MTDTPSAPDIPQIPGLATRRLTPDAFWSAVEPRLQSPLLTVNEVGRSAQARPLRTITFGQGPTGLFLWSQMHGDEATATRALADLLGFLAEGEGLTLHSRLRERLTVTLLPMVNPDGAEAGQRETADGIDINRDARRLVSPEARVLAEVHQRIEPDFGFNLHDQDVRRIAGPEGGQVAFAFLAPPIDAVDSWDPVRRRAGLLAANMAATMLEALPGRIARWTDEYESRAFGERFQQAGTSTVLVETGALPEDPEKEQLRSHLARLLLTTLDRLAGESWLEIDPAAYHELPLNHAVIHDVQLTGGTVVVAGREIAADVALLFDDPIAREGPRLAELGDLGEAVALERVDCTGKWLALTPRTERSPGAVAPEDPVKIEIRERRDGPAIERY